MIIRRKIQKIGKRSFFITLPKDWVEKNNLKEKDSLNIEITKNNNILITYEKKEYKKLEINVENTNLDNLIFLCYYKNINEITLKKKFNLEDKKLIKKTLNILNDYKIIEETDNSIKIICLSEYSNLNFKKILIRMIYLIKLSIKALYNKDRQSLEDNEIEINRLFHTTKKKLINSLNDFKEREINEIKENIEIFYWEEIIKKIENIADLIYEMQFVKFNAKTLITIKEYVDELQKIFINKKELENFIKLIKKYNSYNIRLKSIEGRITQLCKDILECLIELDLNNKCFIEDNILKEV